MMNDPIVVWPPGTFYFDCGSLGSYYDCTGSYPGLAGMGVFVCCPAW